MTETAARWVPGDADVATLRRAAADCRGCELWEPATQVIFSGGSEHARLMLVGEQPVPPRIERACRSSARRVGSCSVPSMTRG